MLILSMASALAFTPDGLTPASEDVCDDYAGAAYGTCVAYCEATDCDEDPNASDRACDRLYDRFEDLTGEAPPCETQEYTIDILYSGDDSTIVHIDGDEQPFIYGDYFWSYEVNRTLTLESGDHVIGFNVFDVGGGPVGLSYMIFVDGQLAARSDDLNASITRSTPAFNWATVGYNDSSWQGTVPCSRTWWYSNNLADLTANGVGWVWTDSACTLSRRSARQTWTRVELSLP